MNGKDFINNFRNTRLNPFSPSSPSSLITRGDIQKRNRTRQIAHGEIDTSINQQQEQNLPAIPKAPSFQYKDPVVENNIEYWRGFADKNTMDHYDELLYILDEASTLDTMDEIKDYISQLKDTTRYKFNNGYRTWINDLEALYYIYDKEQYDRDLPNLIMRDQTEKARTALENGYKRETNPLIKRQSPPSPSELLPQIRNSFN